LDKSLAKPFIEKLAKVDEVIFIDKRLENSVTDVSDNLESFISTSSIDLEAIKKKLSKQKEKLEKEINKLNGMLNNKKFLENAPEAVVAQNQEALSEALEKRKRVEEELAKI